MILLTGGAGFIGSVLLWRLNRQGEERIVVVDRLRDGPKWKNLIGRRFEEFVDREQAFAWLDRHGSAIPAVIHLGACTDTTETDLDYLMTINYAYSQRLWRWAVERGMPFLYASSAATYGGGEHDYEDGLEGIERFRPLNGYAFSKQAFDLWVRGQAKRPPQWAGLKFFNVYGPHEYHKGRMASMVFHGFRQARDAGVIRLFRSHRPAYGDGEQQRDFISVFDCVEVMVWLLEHPQVSGLFNLGTGQARTFNDLARAVFQAMGREPAIEYFDMPEDLRGKYQDYTEAPMARLRSAGYTAPFRALEEGVAECVRNYLVKDDPYLE